MPTFIQPTLSGGELSPALHGRADLAVYQTSLKTCLNFIPQAYGGVRNRQGTRFVASVNNAARQTRLIPFSFNADQNYVLELCGGTEPIGHVSSYQGYIRVISRGRLKTDSSAVPIRSTAPWKGEDLRLVKFSQSADILTATHPKYQPYQVLRKGDADWATAFYNPKIGPWMDENIVKGVSMTASGQTGEVTVSCTKEYFTNDLVGRYIYIRQKDFGIPWEPQATVVKGDIRRSDGKYYVAVATTNTANPWKTGTLRPVHEWDIWNDGGVDWEFLHPGWGFGLITSFTDTKNIKVVVDSDHRFPSGSVTTVPAGAGSRTVDAIVQSSSGTLLCHCSTAHGLDTSTPRTVSGSISWYIPSPEGGSFPYSYDFATAALTVVDADYVIIDIPYAVMSGYSGSVIANFTILSSTVDSSTPQGSYKWGLSAWGGTRGWPSCSAYFQQRHCFAATDSDPQTVWMSRSQSYNDFSESSPIQDDDTVSFTVASAQIDGITSLLPLDKLVMFTLGGNWVTPSDTITPGNAGAKLQNYFGSSNLGPLGIGNTVLYYGRGGTVRDMSYDFASDSYVGNDLLVKASHLFNRRRIVEWAFQEAPFPIIWCVCDDGALISLTYLKEEKVIGWARHDVGGLVESVAVINECGEDHVYLVVTRGAAKNIEVMYSWVDDYYEACFLDSALTYDGRNTDASYTLTISSTGAGYGAGASVNITPNTAVFNTGGGDVGDQVVVQDSAGNLYRITITSVTAGTPNYATGNVVTALPVELQATPTTSWAIARDTFTGLTHLNGQTVGLYKDGAYTTGVVSGNQLTMNPPGFVATVGLPITADIETLDLVIPNGPGFENRKLTDTVRLMVENSRSTYVGESFDRLQEVFVTAPGDDMTALNSGSGLMEASVQASWNRAGHVCIRHTKPYPLSILAIMPDSLVGRS